MTTDATTKDMTPEDPREAALKRGLRQCSDDQLALLARHIAAGKPLLLDRGERGEDCALTSTVESMEDEHEVLYLTAVYSPLAVAASWRAESVVRENQDQVVRESLAEMHPAPWEHNTTRGVEGNFFRGDYKQRLADLSKAIVAVGVERANVRTTAVVLGSGRTIVKRDQQRRGK